MNSILAKSAPVDLNQIRLVLMDIDGTLLSGPEVDLDNVRRQLSKLTHRHKVQFTFATGRTLYGARKVVQAPCGQRSDRLIIAYNGGVIASSDANPWMTRHIIDGAAYVNLIRVCREAGVNPLVYSCKDTFSIKDQQEIVFTESVTMADQKTEFNGMPITLVKSLDNLTTTDVIAILVFEPRGVEFVDKLALRLKNECGSSLRVTTSGGRYVEIAHPQTTKRNAMETLCERLGINANQVMAIGDNFNDLEMLAACGFGVAVANSPSEVKAVCRFVCKHEAARGVVEVLMAIVREFNYEVRRRLVETEKRV